MAKSITQLQQYEDIVKGLTEDVELTSTSLTTLFRFWFDFFFEKIIRIFVYENLPFPYQELEGSAILNGKTFIAYDKKYGFVTRNGSIYGITRYSDVYTHVIYAMPSEGGNGTISGRAKIGERALVLYNTATSLSFLPFLNRYASLATHFDLTIKSLLIDSRYPDTFVAYDESTRDSINEFFKNKYEGKAGSILDESLLASISGGVINLNANKHNTNEILTAINGQNELLRSFYRDIGLRWIKDKRANMVTDEVDGNDSVLLFNTSDMLYQRQKWVNDVNELFKEYLPAPITVKLNPAFILINEEGEKNNETNNT